MNRGFTFVAIDCPPFSLSRGDFHDSLVAKPEPMVSSILFLAVKGIV
jgi:hypothetical protein